eukprot:g5051.t1
MEGNLDAINLSLKDFVYRSADGFFGTENVQVFVSDQGHSGPGGVKKASLTITLEVTAFADVPTIRVAQPAASPGVHGTVMQGQKMAIVDVVVELTARSAQANVTDNVVDLECRAQHGLLEVLPRPGIWVVSDGSTDATVKMRGTVAHINDAMGQQFLQYTGPSAWSGVDTISVSGSGLAEGDKRGSALVAVQVVKVDVRPTFSSPPEFTVEEDAVLLLQNISVSAPDLGIGEVLSVTLSASHGVVSVQLTKMSNKTTVRFTAGDGTDDALVTFVGDLRAVNEVLGALTYKGVANFNGLDSIRASIGGDVTQSIDIPVHVMAVNDAPTIGTSDAHTALSVTQGDTLTVPGFSVTDADVGEAFGGMLAVTVKADWNGMEELIVTASKLPGSDVQTTERISVSVTPVNDAPKWTLPGRKLLVNEDEWTLLKNVSLSDADTQGSSPHAASQILHAELSAQIGRLRLAEHPAGLYVVTTTPRAGEKDGFARIVIRGTSSVMNAALQQLQYVGAANAVGNDAVTFVASDLNCCGTGDSGADVSESLTIEIAALNDAPQIVQPARVKPVEIAGDADVMVYTATGLRIVDVDIGEGLLQVSLAVSRGLLTLGQRTGLDFIVGSGVADPKMSFRATTTHANAALQVLRYRSGLRYSGSDSIEVTVNDGGGAFQGKGGAQTTKVTVPLEVSAANAAPIVSVSPTALVMDEDTRLGITGLKIDDSADSMLEVSIGAGHASELAVQKLETSVTHINQVQQVVVDAGGAVAVGGNFALQLDLSTLKDRTLGQGGVLSSGPIAHNAVARISDEHTLGESVQAKLDAMLSLAQFDITVDVSRPIAPDAQGAFTWLVTFLNAPFDVPLLSAVGAGTTFTPGTATLSVLHHTVSNGMSGQFSLGMGDYTTKLLRHDTDAAGVKAALDALPSHRYDVHVLQKCP